MTQEKVISLKNSVNKNIWCGVIFAVYAVITLIGALNHEIWYDEGQAWVIVRDNDFMGVINQLKYEGHPPLWYAILYVFAHTGFECTIIPVISWFFTAAAALLVMFKAPFNIGIRTIVIFSGGFLYFNSVISRVYCLINLILVLIAILYPKRKEHPILFGILVALLANTHLCVSGFIGILGIFMIIDLFKDFKGNTAKRNAGNIIGLLISGIGVLMLVMPLLNSVSLNSTTSEKEISLEKCIRAFFDVFNNVSLSTLENSWVDGYIIYLVSAVMALLFIIQMIFMRHKTKPLLMLVTFYIFYVITSEIFWFTIPNRAYIFVLMFFIVLWISEYEPENNAKKIWDKEIKADSKLLGKLINHIRSADLNYKKLSSACISVIMALSIPVAAAYLFVDYANSFSLSKGTADFIKENISPENSVFITDLDELSQTIAYLPGYNFYAVNSERMYTYTFHDEYSYDSDVDLDKVYNDLKDFVNVYYIISELDSEHYTSGNNIIYLARNNLKFEGSSGYVEISKIELEDLYKYI